MLTDRRFALAATAVATAFLVTPARASDDEEPALRWRDEWHRADVVDYAFTSTMGVAAIGLELAGKPTEPGWTGPILFDTAARNALVSDEPGSRDEAARASDVLLWTGIAHPVVLDGVLVTWLGHQSPDVAWQMFVMNAQAYSLTLALTSLTKQVIARERPFVRECRDDPGYSAACGSSTRFRSFVSGHASLTATGAGLMCAHHTQLPLYGSDVLDAGTCLFAIVGTTATGALRLTSDVHYASDVIAGHLLGYASGYLLPTLRYYRAFRWNPQALSPHAEVAVLPLASGSRLGLQLLGAW